MKNKTIAVIPARGGSKRLPGKNVKLLGDLPLIAHSIRYAQVNKAIVDEIWVSTDNQEIKKEALKYGAKVIDRPAEFSGDDEPTVSALKHVLEILADSTIENLILLQPTNPLRPEDLLANAFQVFKNNDCESLFTVSRSFHKLGKIQDNKFIPFNYTVGQRSQDLEPLYYENGLLYIAKVKTILEGKVISEDALPFEVNHPFADVDIDIEEDFEYAQYLYNKFIIHNS